MAPFIRLTKSPYLLLFLLSLLITSCDDSDSEEANKFEVPVFDASVSTRSILAGESVTFIDKSTKVHKRVWSFPDGEAVYESDSIVTVTYKYGGEYIAKLTVTFIDNSTKIRQDTIVVEGKSKPVDPEITGASYGVYTEHTNVTAGKAIAFVSANQFVFKELGDDNFHGEKAKGFTVDGTGPGSGDWAMGLVQYSGGAQDDLSQFANGYLNLALKSTSTGNIRIRIRGVGLDAFLVLTEAGKEYGFARDGAWHMLSIPVADIMAAIPEADRAGKLIKVTEPLILRSDVGVDIRTVNNYNFDVDNIFYTINKPVY
jgi:PKD repeat protein